MKLNEYPIVYISTNGEICDYEWIPLEIQPYLFPGMELLVGDKIMSVVRVLVSNIKGKLPILYVLISPCLKQDFVNDEHIEVVKGIYADKAKQLILQEKENTLGDNLTKALESHKWN